MSACQRFLSLPVLVVSFAFAALLPEALPGQASRGSATGGDVSEELFDEVLKHFEWRGIGPSVGGRSIAVAGSPDRPLEYWFGATGGGLWKTTNGGTDWFPVTDGQIASASVGAVGVCRADPDVVYIGTGEAQFRGTMSMGDGAYRSTDGGENWTRIGLESSTGQQVIARLRVHPRDCERVWAAVMGDPWGPNPERGVYRTDDGGQSWERILFRSENAGAYELILDPADPNVIYTSFWHVQRRPWEANSGGPDSGIFKSTDGGSTWTELTARPGLPRGRTGKIGIAVSGAASERVWALVEHENGGMYRSDDGGATWARVNDHRALYSRSEYYMRIVADPQDRETVYVLGNNGFYRSRDGGETYRRIPVPHGDNHDLWIDPDDPLRMIQSNDGGANVSFDGGETWTAQDYPTSQMYHALITNEYPYYVCGGQQDNSSKCLPADGDGSYWYNSAAGEQGYIAVHPENPDLHIGGAQRGYLARLDRQTEQRHNIEVWPDNPQGLPPNRLKERFQWTFPILLSPHDPDVLYVASQHVFRSRDRGDSWERISPDLSYADPATLEGEKSIVPNQNSQDYYATVFTLEPSPHDYAVIWAGTDDGRIHVTRDGGDRWKDVTPPDLPMHSRVSLISASPHVPGKVYAAVERYKMQDLSPYIFRTEDWGESWRMVVGGIEPHHYVRAVEEDSVRPGLLVAGTEHGPYVSFDDGERWRSLSVNLPDLQVSDVEFVRDDVVIATYGRGFYVLDGVLPVLRQLEAGVEQNSVHLFEPAGAIRSLARNSKPYSSTGLPWANRVEVFYRLAEPAHRVRIEFLDSSGEVIRSFEGTPGTEAPRLVRDHADHVVNGPPTGWSTPVHLPTVEAGTHRFAWDMRPPPAHEFEGMWIRGGSTAAPRAVPGPYRVRLFVDGVTREATFDIEPDPRLGGSGVTLADLQEQFDLGMRIHARLDDATRAVSRIRTARERTLSRARRAGSAEEREAYERFEAELREVEGTIYQYRMRSPSGSLQYGIRLTNKLANLLHHTLLSADAPPTPQTYEVFDELSRELDAALGRLDEVLARSASRGDDPGSLD